MNREATTTQMPEAERLAELDSVLVRHPFGNSEYVTEQMHRSFKRRLGKIAVHKPVAGRLADAVDKADSYRQYRVLGDMVVRCAIQHALTQVETDTAYGLPLDMCEEIFAATARQVEDGTYGPLGSGLTGRVGPNPHDPWIWGDRAEDVFSKAFRQVVAADYGQLPCAITPDENAMLVKGTELMAELLPLSSRSALSHVHLVAAFPHNGALSSSEYRLSGTIFLSRSLLSNPWSVAEYVFHEALHQQLYDFRQGHSLIHPDFDRKDAPTICSLWNVADQSRGNYWDVHRSLAAFHVYVHLALLSGLAKQRAHELEEVYGRQSLAERMTPSRTALSRAHYLEEQLRGPFWQELGPAGKRLVDWFASVMDVIDPSPPPPGSFLHLILDRYSREARQIAFLAAEAGEPPPDFSDQLVSLTKEEVSRVREVLTEVEGTSELGRFNEAVAAVFDEEPAALLPDGNPGEQFARVRHLIITSLLRASIDGYRMSDRKGPDESVRRMIEQSTETVTTLVGR